MKSNNSNQSTAPRQASGDSLEAHARRIEIELGLGEGEIVSRDVLSRAAVSQAELGSAELGRAEMPGGLDACMRRNLDAELSGDALPALPSKKALWRRRWRKENPERHSMEQRAHNRRKRLRQALAARPDLSP